MFVLTVLTFAVFLGQWPNSNGCNVFNPNDLHVFLSLFFSPDLVRSTRRAAQLKIYGGIRFWKYNPIMHQSNTRMGQRSVRGLYTLKRRASRILIGLFLAAAREEAPLLLRVECVLRKYCLKTLKTISYSKQLLAKNLDTPCKPSKNTCLGQLSKVSSAF